MTFPHLDGEIRNSRHHMQVRVYYEDTDFSGIVYHANYLRFMERGRTEFFRLAGVTAMADLESAEPSAWAIRRADISFLRPARVDDSLEVRTALTGISGARLAAIQRIYAQGNLLVEGRIEACVITLTGRPRRIPPAVRDLLAPFLQEDAI